MKLIREPKDVDFTVDGRELTAEEQQKISEYIQRQKAMRLRKARQTQPKLNYTTCGADAPAQQS